MSFDAAGLLGGILVVGPAEFAGKYLSGVVSERGGFSVNVCARSFQTYCVLMWVLKVFAFRASQSVTDGRRQ